GAEIHLAMESGERPRRQRIAPGVPLSDGEPVSDVVAAAERAIAAEPDAAFPLLVERFRTEFHDCPDRVVAWLARLGIARPEAERAMLCDALATSGERWAGPSFSSHSGGTSPTEAWKRAYGCLAIGASQSPGELRGFLTDDNSALRLAAAARLAAHPDRVAAAADAELETQLWQAVTADHPAKSKFRYGRNGTADFPTDYQAEIGADAALALLATEQLPDRHGTLLHAALAAPDHSRRNAVGGEIPRAALLARAIARWGAGASAADLRDAAQDDRPEVAEAARQALAARDGR
ncbi:MAG: hypothetical protein KDE27_05665, partial [Planctomycetes bacterium]|nr:hypothetical protein [Planctomycetota bacterium]